jgi:hypothetical protein
MAGIYYCCEGKTCFLERDVDQAVYIIIVIRRVTNPEPIVAVLGTRNPVQIKFNGAGPVMTRAGRRKAQTLSKRGAISISSQRKGIVLVPIIFEESLNFRRGPHETIVMISLG